MKYILLLLFIVLTSESYSQSIFGLDVTPAVTTKTININMAANTIGYTNALWNTWFFDVSQTSPTLNYTTGSSSGITCSIPSAPDYQQNASGYVTSPMCPDSVGRMSWKTNTSKVMTISGLNNAKTYDITFYCSNNSGFDEKVTFTIGATSVVIHDNNNTGPAQSITGVSPTSNQIQFTMTATDFQAYLNGFTITEH